MATTADLYERIGAIEARQHGRAGGLQEPTGEILGLIRDLTRCLETFARNYERHTHEPDGVLDAARVTSCR